MTFRENQPNTTSEELRTKTRGISKNRRKAKFPGLGKEEYLESEARKRRKTKLLKTTKIRKSENKSNKGLPFQNQRKSRFSQFG